MAEILHQPANHHYDSTLMDSGLDRSFDLSESINDEDIPERPSNPDPSQSIDGRLLNDTFDLKERANHSELQNDSLEEDPVKAAREQLLLERELQKMQEEMNDMDDYMEPNEDNGYPEEDDGYPQMDMKERLRQLNAEWGAEEIIERTNTKVNFKEDLVTMAAPPPEYSDEEGMDELTSSMNSSGNTHGPGGSHSSGEASGSEVTQNATDTQPQQSGAGDEMAGTIQSHSDPPGVDQKIVGDQGKGEGDLAAMYQKQMTLSESDSLQSSLDDDRHVVQDERYRSSSNLDKIGQDSNFYGQEKPDNESVVETQRKSPNDNKVLIERNGKFELIDVSELSMEERSMMGLLSPPQETINTQPNQSNNSASDGSQFTPHPPYTPPQTRERPHTAQPVSLQRQQTPQRRIQSAKTSNVTYEESWSYTRPVGSSRYGLTPEQKEFKKKQMMLKAKRLREQREREEEDRRQQQEEAESCFQAWLKKKKEEVAQKKKEEKEKRRDEFEKRQQQNPNEAQENFEAWLNHKKQQAKLERKISRRQTQEDKRAYFYRSREECDQAFKEWVRSKNRQLHEDRSMKRADALYTTQTAKKSKKARSISKAINLAQVYRYTDYYGYRF